MRKLIYYMFYRTSKLYRELDVMGENKSYYVHGRSALIFALCTNFLTIIGVLCFTLKTQYGLITSCGAWLLLCIFGFFVLDEKKYKKLEKVYKNEKNAEFKGWLVFAYYVCSMITFAVSLVLLCYV